MIKVSLSLFKIQRDEALARNNKEAAMMAMRSMDNSNEEKWRLEKDLENCIISSESFEDQEKGYVSKIFYVSKFSVAKRL